MEHQIIAPFVEKVKPIPTEQAAKKIKPNDNTFKL